MERTEAIQGLRDLANYFESNPTLPLPGEQEIWLFVNTIEELITAAKSLGRAAKSTSNSFYMIKQQFGLFTIEYNLNRSSICTAQVIGKKKVITHKQIVAPVYEDVEEEVDDVQWTCPESLLALAKE